MGVIQVFPITCHFTFRINAVMKTVLCIRFILIFSKFSHVRVISPRWIMIMVGIIVEIT